MNGTKFKRVSRRERNIMSRIEQLKEENKMLKEQFASVEKYLKERNEEECYCKACIHGIKIRAVENGVWYGQKYACELKIKKTSCTDFELNKDYLKEDNGPTTS